MREIEITHREAGPHPGWFREQFLVGEQLYELFTIDRPDEKRSSIRKMENQHTGDSILHVNCVLNGQAAYMIIVELNSVYDQGCKDGRQSLVNDFRKLFD